MRGDTNPNQHHHSHACPSPSPYVLPLDFRHHQWRFKCIHQPSGRIRAWHVLCPIHPRLLRDAILSSGYLWGTLALPWGLAHKLIDISVPPIVQRSTPIHNLIPPLPIPGLLSGFTRFSEESSLRTRHHIRTRLEGLACAVPPLSAITNHPSDTSIPFPTSTIARRKVRRRGTSRSNEVTRHKHPFFTLMFPYAHCACHGPKHYCLSYFSFILSHRHAPPSVNLLSSPSSIILLIQL